MKRLLSHAQFLGLGELNIHIYVLAGWIPVLRVVKQSYNAVFLKPYCAAGGLAKVQTLIQEVWGGT